MKLVSVLALAVAAFLHRPVAAGDLAAPAWVGGDAVRVVSARPDPAHRQWVLQCRDRARPAAPAFAVMVRASAQELRQAAFRPGAPAPPQAPRPFDVRAGRAATLTISRPGFALSTAVVPLEAGRTGQTIRVRSLATHAVISALVSGPDQLRLNP